MKNKNITELNEKDLSNVSGGGHLVDIAFESDSNISEYNLSDDSRYLNVLLRGRAGQCDRYGSFKAAFYSGEIKNAWSTVGISLSDGHYFLGGQQISRTGAMAHAASVVGKTLKQSDWDW